MIRRGWTLTAAAALGVALLVWTIASVGARAMATQLNALAPVLPLMLCLAGVRFLCQAAGWRLALAPGQQPLWREAFAAVVAGEAAGYFTWGPVSREPMKALLVEHRVPQRQGLAAAIAERTVYAAVATALILGAIGIVAVRLHHFDWFVVALAGVGIAALAAQRVWMRVANGVASRPSVLPWIVTAAAAQEMTNLIEAYVVLAWLGASPTLTSVVVLEGIGRLLNGAGQFIPGKLGVSEAASAGMAEFLQLGASHGLSLALARRVRSMVWSAAGVGFVTLRAAQSKWQTA